MTAPNYWHWVGTGDAYILKGVANGAFAFVLYTNGVWLAGFHNGEDPWCATTRFLVGGHDHDGTALKAAKQWCEDGLRSALARHHKSPKPTEPVQPAQYDWEQRDADTAVITHASGNLILAMVTRQPRESEDAPHLVVAAYLSPHGGWHSTTFAVAKSAREWCVEGLNGRGTPSPGKAEPVTQRYLDTKKKLDAADSQIRDLQAERDLFKTRWNVAESALADASSALTQALRQRDEQKAAYDETLHLTIKHRDDHHARCTALEHALSEVKEELANTRKTLELVAAKLTMARRNNDILSASNVKLMDDLRAAELRLDSVVKNEANQPPARSPLVDAEARAAICAVVDTLAPHRGNGEYVHNLHEAVKNLRPSAEPEKPVEAPPVANVLWATDNIDRHQSILYINGRASAYVWDHVTFGRGFAADLRCFDENIIAGARSTSGVWSFRVFSHFDRLDGRKGPAREAARQWCVETCGCASSTTYGKIADD